MVCTFADITIRKNSDDRLNLCLNSASIGLLEWDLKSNKFLWDKSMFDIYEVNESSLPTSISDWENRFLFPEDIVPYRNAINNAIAKSEDINFIFRIILASKKIKYIQVKGFVKQDVSGNSIKYYGINRDVTEEYNAKKNLVNIQFALNSSAIVSCANKDKKIIFVNDKFCELSGYNRHELIGQKHTIFNSGFHKKEFFTELLVTITSGNIWHGEICHKKKTGEFYWVDTYIVPIKGSGKIVEQYISIHFDITEKKKQQIELAEVYLKAENATKAKSNFLYTMSHEIRTPLNGILSLTELLQETVLSDSQMELSQTISKSGKSLLNIINSVLDFSKIEAGKMDLEEIEFDICSSLKELLKPFEFMVHKKNIAFKIECENYEYNIFGDEGKIGQVISNLVSNAIKFTNIGEVCVKINLKLFSNYSLFRFEVHDTGIGILDEAKNRLFEAFSQGEKSIIRHFGGTGLGLSITKRLVELMGGEISFQSEYGKGSGFYVDIPFRTGNKITREIKKGTAKEISNLKVKLNGFV